MSRLLDMDTELTTREELRALLVPTIQQLHNLTLYARQCAETFGSDATETLLAREAQCRFQVIETRLAKGLAELGEENLPALCNPLPDPRTVME